MKRVVKIEEFETTNSIIEEGRSINKISKELSDTVSKMKEIAPTFNSLEGKEKDKVRKVLLDLTAKKKELLKELDDAVLGKDKNIELELSEELEGHAKKMKEDGASDEEIKKMHPEVSDEDLKEAKFNKQKLIKAVKKDDGFIQLGDGTEYLIYKYDNGNDDNDDMWQDKVIFALDQDGGEHEVKYSDIVSYNESAVEEAIVSEARRIQTKRKYTENHPPKTVGYHAKARNKILEAIKDGKITQDEFDNIIKEFSKDGKRWLKRNGKMFNVSENGISLSKFGKRILKGITINEANVNPSGYVKAGKLGYNDQFLGRRSLSYTLSVDLGMNPKHEFSGGDWLGFDHVSMYVGGGKKEGTILGDALTGKYTYDELKSAAADFLGIKESVVNESKEVVVSKFESFNNIEE